MSDDNSMHLPRTLVNQLLHTAQSDPARVCWGVIAGRDGKPEDFHAFAASHPSQPGFRALMEKLRKQGHPVWAVYSLAPGEPVLPGLGELEHLGITRFLGVSLATQGVLQLRGWRVENDALREIPVSYVAS